MPTTICFTLPDHCDAAEIHRRINQNLADWDTGVRAELEVLASATVDTAVDASLDLVSSLTGGTTTSGTVEASVEATVEAVAKPKSRKKKSK